MGERRDDLAKWAASDMTFAEARDLLLQSFRLLEAEVKLWRERHPDEAVLVRDQARRKPHA